jgi:hypothetical protein
MVQAALRVLQELRELRVARVQAELMVLQEHRERMVQAVQMVQVALAELMAHQELQE